MLNGKDSQNVRPRELQKRFHSQRKNNFRSNRLSLIDEGVEHFAKNNPVSKTDLEISHDSNTFDMVLKLIDEKPSPNILACELEFVFAGLLFQQFIFN